MHVFTCYRSAQNGVKRTPLWLPMGLGLSLLTMLPPAAGADDITTQGAQVVASAAGVKTDKALVPPEATTNGEEEKKAPVTAPKPPKNSFSVNADVYMGMTNYTGITRRSNDGIWAGYGPFLPSNLSFNWRNDSGRGFRFSVGIGDMFNSSQTIMEQPVELFYQTPTRAGGTLTMGKFYVPFGSYEWEYESKWGMMHQGTIGRADYSAAVTFNNNQRSANAYLRLGKTWRGRTSLGVSAGVGRGIMYNTSHNAAMGVDFGHDFGAVTLNSEYNFANGQNGLFQFAYGKLTFTRLGNIKPYFGIYYWGDKAQEMGGFRSVVTGATIQLNRFLALEGSYARSDGRDVFWVQSHLNF